MIVSVTVQRDGASPLYGRWDIKSLPVITHFSKFSAENWFQNVSYESVIYEAGWLRENSASPPFSDIKYEFILLWIRSWVKTKRMGVYDTERGLSQPDVPYCQLTVQEKFVSESFFFPSPFLSHSPWAGGIIFDSAETEQVEREKPWEMVQKAAKQKRPSLIASFLSVLSAFSCSERVGMQRGMKRSFFFLVGVS